MVAATRTGKTFVVTRAGGPFYDAQLLRRVDSLEVAHPHIIAGQRTGRRSFVSRHRDKSHGTSGHVLTLDQAQRVLAQVNLAGRI